MHTWQADINVQSATHHHTPQVSAPVFGDLPRLPAPLGTLFHTLPLFTRLPLADRLSALGLVGPLLEHDADEATYARWVWL